MSAVTAASNGTVLGQGNTTMSSTAKPVATNCHEGILGEVDEQTIQVQYAGLAYYLFIAL